MGDATHNQVQVLAGVPGLDIVAGYVTGSPDIQWTGADWARFPSALPASIDQGFTGSPVKWATIRDVEPGAWTPAAAADRSGWYASRPTIYCDQNDLERPGGVLASGWRGDLWLAIPGWTTGTPLPDAPGCTIVAVQNQQDVQNAYDLSVVLDPDWPHLPEAHMKILTIDRATVPAGVNWPGSWLLRCDGTVRWLSADEVVALKNANITEEPGYAYADWKALSGVQ